MLTMVLVLVLLALRLFVSPLYHHSHYVFKNGYIRCRLLQFCLLYTSDAADEMD